MTDALLFDPASPAFRADPHPTFARLRERDPVHWSPALKGWVVTRYGDVQQVMRDATMSADRITPFYAAQPPEGRSRMETLVAIIGRWLVFRDPPDHTRLRGLIARAFTPAAMVPIRANIEAIVTDLLDLLPADGPVDLVAAFANPLPAYVIMDMLGVPRAMLPEMKSWSDDIRLFIGTARTTPDKYALATRGVSAMAEAFRLLIAEHRVHPKPDVLSTLIAANETGSKLSDEELIATAILFLFAGHETTTSLIAMASLALMRDEAARELFLTATGSPALAIEEFLRFDGPTPAMMRVALVPHQLGIRDIAVGDRVWTMISAANRDPSVFREPDRLDLGRSPNPHVTFGFGTHFCLGAPLARLEAAIALPALHNRYPRMRLLDPAAAIDWADGLGLRGPVCLNVELGQRR